jgi:hypothetical protein
MKEAPVTARPHNELKNWQAFRIGDGLFFEGTVSGPAKVLAGEIKYFDRDTQCGVSEDGLVWKIPPENVYCLGNEDCTSEFLEMMETPILDIAITVLDEPTPDSTNLTLRGYQSDSELQALKSDDDLKPCPFCGYRTNQMRADVAPLSSSSNGSIWHVACSVGYGGCGAYVAGTSRQEAIKSWNRRVHDEDDLLPIAVRQDDVTT